MVTVLALAAANVALVVLVCEFDNIRARHAARRARIRLNRMTDQQIWRALAADYDTPRSN